MELSQLKIATEHFTKHYEVAARYNFAVVEKVYLNDHGSEQDRLCRFCRRGKPEVAFSAEAHAIPAFFGNNSVFSNNECNACNHLLANNFEDHLGKWTSYQRSLVGVNGRKKPTFKSYDGSLRADRGENGVHIKLTNTNSVPADALKDINGPFEYTLPADGVSQPYVPLRAAMALIKIGCSICPLSLLSQCEPAIDWLMNRKGARLSYYPILYAFTPGTIADAASEVTLINRIDDEQIPFFWIILQYKNFRLQTFIPFCPKDTNWLREGIGGKLTTVHYPSKFGPNWYAGDTQYGHVDWSSTESTTTSSKVRFHFHGRIATDQ